MGGGQHLADEGLRFGATPQDVFGTFPKHWESQETKQLQNPFKYLSVALFFKNSGLKSAGCIQTVMSKIELIQQVWSMSDNYLFLCEEGRDFVIARNNNNNQNNNQFYNVFLINASIEMSKPVSEVGICSKFPPIIHFKLNGSFCWFSIFEPVFILK